MVHLLPFSKLCLVIPWFRASIPYQLVTQIDIWRIHMSTVTTKKLAHVRLREGDKELLEKLAKKLDVSEADVIRIALKKLAHEFGLDEP